MLYGSNMVDTNVVFPHGCPQGCMSYPVKCLLEVNKDMVEILVLQVLFAEVSKVENVVLLESRPILQR